MIQTHDRIITNVTNRLDRLELDPGPVLTFSIQLGSGGHAVAEGVSRALGCRYIDRDVITLAASRAGVTAELMAGAERWPRFIERLFQNLVASRLEDEDIPTPCLAEGITMRRTADYRSLIEQVVVDLSTQGNCVIVEHSAHVVLQGRQDVLKVLVVGSAERRSKRLRQERRITLEQARAVVRDSDRERQQYFRHAYGVDWLNPSLYDLIVNTDALDNASAATIVMKAANKNSTTAV